MDRLEEIRQHCEGGGPIRRIDMKYLLSEVDRLTALHKREIIVTGEYAQRVIDLTARAEAAEAERDAAGEDLRQNGFCGSCSGCNAPHDPNNIKWCYSWEWRGPQAGKGEAK